jgi:PTS system mannitol-specific IIC component
MAKSIKAKSIEEIVVVCEAGIGSSLMTVNWIKKELRKLKVEGIEVYHSAASRVDEDATFIVCHEAFEASVKKRAKSAVIVTFKYFLNDPVLAKLVADIAAGKTITSS